MNEQGEPLIYTDKLRVIYNQGAPNEMRALEETNVAIIPKNTSLFMDLPVAESLLFCILSLDFRVLHTEKFFFMENL